MHEERGMRRSEAANYLQERIGAYTAETLAKLAVTGGGPRFVKVGPYPLYKASDLEAWIASRTTKAVSSTSELAAPSAA